MYLAFLTSSFMNMGLSVQLSNKSWILTKNHAYFTVTIDALDDYISLLLMSQLGNSIHGLFSLGFFQPVIFRPPVPPTHASLKKPPRRKTPIDPLDPQTPPSYAP